MTIHIARETEARDLPIASWGRWGGEKTVAWVPKLRLGFERGIYPRCPGVHNGPSPAVNFTPSAEAVKLIEDGSAMKLRIR